MFTTKASEEFVLLDRLTRFSEWSKAVKAVARLQRFIRKHKTDSNISTVEERKVAEKSIMKMVQQGFFQEEIKQLNSGSLSKSRNFQLHSLDPFIDDQGYLRVGGRLKQSTLPFEIKHHVILPKDSHICISSLIIAYYLEKIQHQGRGMTINEIRSNGIWIVGCSKAVASRIYKCVKCRKMRRPKEEQLMSDLPEDRMETSPPFTFCGMDCFGPFYVKEGHKEIKRYGLLFTCMCSRAVHIEMLDDMTTDAFINSLRCFLAIRGAVQQIRSDRESNFVRAQNEFLTLQEEELDKIETFLQGNQFEFLMNTPSSSHMGGVWERQIRTIRSVLTSILDQFPGRLYSASLRTFLYESMAIVNSRPLTTDTLNDPKSPEPLTPNHLLTMKTKVVLPPSGNFVKEDMYARKRLRRVQYLANQFWNRWRKEYLLNLQKRQK